MTELIEQELRVQGKALEDAKWCSNCIAKSYERSVKRFDEKTADQKALFASSRLYELWLEHQEVTKQIESLQLKHTLLSEKMFYLEKAIRSGDFEKCKEVIWL